MRFGVIVSFLAVLGIALLVFEDYYSTRVSPHVSVDGMPMGGVLLADVPAYLQQQIDSRNNTQLILHAGDSTYEVTNSKFSPHYNLDPVVAAVRDQGHTGNLPSRIWNQLSTLLSGHDVPLQGSHDTSAVQKYVGQIAKDIALAPQPAKVGIANGQVEVVREPLVGRYLDVAAATHLLDTEINTHSVFNVTLPVQYPPSPVTHDIAQQTVDQAQGVLSQNVFFSSLNKVKKWYLKPSQLLHLLVFTPGQDAQGNWQVTMSLDTKKLAKTMAPIAAAVNHEPIPAYFRFVDAANGQPAAAVPYSDSPGLTIDIDKAAQAILASPANGHVAVIPFSHPHSAFTVAKARALSFDTPMGTSVVDILGSSMARTGNADVTASKLNNIRIAPGQSFSVTSAISPVVKLNAYVPAPGGTGLSYDIAGTNGGPTAAASALFEAAFSSGLSIKERAAYPNITVFNGVPGQDALVHARKGGADLVFVNNTKHTILIGMVVQGSLIKGYVFNNDVVQRTTTVKSVVMLNQDGSIDAQYDQVSTGDMLSQQRYSSHYNNVDQYP
jgi:vancomycin resistance protein YoaR